MILKACAQSVMLFVCLYCLPMSKALSEDAGVAWTEPSVTFHIGNLLGANDLWKSVFEEAALRWNDTDTQFTFNTTRSSGSGYCSNLGDNNVRFSATNCGETWGASVLGVTTFWSKASVLQKVDISFNNAHDWNVYDGNVQSYAADFRRVAAHEMGHAVGLAHALDNNHLMSATANNSYLPTVDDVNSLRDKYGFKRHTLTIHNLGSGRVDITPKVMGTGVMDSNLLHTSNYQDFLNCTQEKCELSIQDGLRLIVTATPDDGALFINWDGTLIQESVLALAPMSADRVLVANFTNLNGSGNAVEACKSDLPLQQRTPLDTSDCDILSSASSLSESGGGSFSLYLLAIFLLLPIRNLQFLRF